jgi:hypothetical protein
MAGQVPRNGSRVKKELFLLSIIAEPSSSKK